MLKIFISCALALFCFLLPLNTVAPATDVVVNGSVYFECSLTSTYMKKHGYVLIEKDLRLNNFKVDRYGARDAEVVIKNHTDAVIGTGTTDKRGAFSISVPEDNTHRVIIRFHEQEIKKVVSSSDAQDMITSLGYVDTEKVARWITVPALYDCHTCDIRYLESKKQH